MPREGGRSRASIASVNFVLGTSLLSGFLFVGIIALVALGRRCGRPPSGEEEGTRAGLVTIEAAVYGLLGLLLAFTFSGAAERFAARRAMTTERYGSKAIYYLAGLTEGSETVLVFIAMTLAPQWFEPLAYGFGALCLATTAERVWRGAVAFRNRPPEPHSAG